MDLYSRLVLDPDLAHQWSSRVYFDQERLVYAKALQYLRPGDSCLDWGCGNGHFSYFLREHGFLPHAYALDGAPELISLSRIPFTKGGDATFIPFPDETFDAVFGVGVLEHVHERGGNPQRSLTELRRVLKPGGLLFIFHLPNALSALEWAKGLVGAQQHERRFSAADMEELFSSLHVLERGRYHLLPRRELDRLPTRNSSLVCSAVNATDDVLSFLFRPICQNWYCISRKTHQR